MNATQIQALNRAVGFPEAKNMLMSAIALGESGGDPNIINPGRGAGGRPTAEYSVGLYQINTLVHKNYSVQQLKDPTINAKEALRILNSQGLRAWGSYTDGRYKKYLPQAQAAYSGKIITTADVQPILNNNLPVNAPDDPTKYIIYAVMGVLGFILITR